MAETETPVPVKEKVIRKSALHQSAFAGLFVIGIAWFAYQMGEIFQTHEDWSFISHPHFVGDMLKTASAAVMAIAGALGVNVRDLFAKKVSEKP